MCLCKSAKQPTESSFPLSGINVRHFIKNRMHYSCTATETLLRYLFIQIHRLFIWRKKNFYFGIKVDCGSCAALWEMRVQIHLWNDKELLLTLNNVSIHLCFLSSHTSSPRLVTRHPRPPLPLHLRVWGMGGAVCSHPAISPPSVWPEDGFSFGSSSAWQRASVHPSHSSPSTHAGASHAAPRCPATSLRAHRYDIITYRYIYSFL